MPMAGHGLSKSGVTSVHGWPWESRVTVSIALKTAITAITGNTYQIIGMARTMLSLTLLVVVGRCRACVRVVWRCPAPTPLRLDDDGIQGFNGERTGKSRAGGVPFPDSGCPLQSEVLTKNGTNQLLRYAMQWCWILDTKNCLRYNIVPSCQRVTQNGASCTCTVDAQAGGGMHDCAAASRLRNHCSVQVRSRCLQLASSASFQGEMVFFPSRKLELFQVARILSAPTSRPFTATAMEPSHTCSTRSQLRLLFRSSPPLSVRR